MRSIFLYEKKVIEFMRSIFMVKIEKKVVTNNIFLFILNNVYIKKVIKIYMNQI